LNGLLQSGLSIGSRNCSGMERSAAAQYRSEALLGRFQINLR
jgi:hypothetical protein